MWKLYAYAEPAASAATDKARSVFFITLSLLFNGVNKN